MGGAWVVPPLVAGHGHVDWASFTALEWVLLVGSALFVIWSIWRAVVLTVHPGEEEPTHIKRMILSEPALPGPPLNLDVSASRTTQEGRPTRGETS